LSICYGWNRRFKLSQLLLYTPFLRMYTAHMKPNSITLNVVSKIQRLKLQSCIFSKWRKKKKL